MAGDEVCGLLLDGFDHLWVAVTDYADAVGAHAVNVFTSVYVPQSRTSAFYDD
jgi:hypothetical protein